MKSRTTTSTNDDDGNEQPSIPQRLTSKQSQKEFKNQLDIADHEIATTNNKKNNNDNNNDNAAVSEWTARQVQKEIDKQQQFEEETQENTKAMSEWTAKLLQKELTDNDDQVDNNKTNRNNNNNNTNITMETSEQDTKKTKLKHLPSTDNNTRQRQRRQIEDEKEDDDAESSSSPILDHKMNDGNDGISPGAVHVPGMQRSSGLLDDDGSQQESTVQSDNNNIRHEGHHHQSEEIVAHLAVEPELVIAEPLIQTEGKKEQEEKESPPPPPPKICGFPKSTFVILVASLLILAAVSTSMGIALSRKNIEEQQLVPISTSESPMTSSEPTFAPSSISISMPPTNNTAASDGTSSSTLVPSSSPSLQPTSTPTCTIDLQTDCTPPDVAESCDSIPFLFDFCTQQPHEFIFNYNGGSCDQSFNLQPTGIFKCEDYGSRPGAPIDSNAFSYIVAFDATEFQIYFQGFVKVGTEFRLSTNDVNVAIGTILNITVYDIPSDIPSSGNEADIIIQSENIVQTVTISTDCERMFRLDRFGSIQLTGWRNIEQGLVSNSESTYLSFTIIDFQSTNNITNGISNGSTSTPQQVEVELTELLALTSFGDFDLSNQLNGAILPSPSPLTFGLNIRLDLDSQQLHMFEIKIRGVSSTGEDCVGIESYEFLAPVPS